MEGDIPAVTGVNDWLIVSLSPEGPQASIATKIPSPTNTSQLLSEWAEISRGEQ